MWSKNGVMPMDSNRTVSFSLGEMAFEYDEEKNRINIKKHGISFRSAARIFFDYDRIEFFDDNHSGCEVYTERVRVEENGKETDVTRLISARLATEFERGLYYGKS